MKNKLTRAELLRLQSIADKLQFCGYGGSKNNARTESGDIALIRKVIAINKPESDLPVS